MVVPAVNDLPSPSSPTPGIAARWWRSRIGYPDARTCFQPTAQRDMLHSLRSMARFMTVGVIALLAVLASSVTGSVIPIPTWAPALSGLALGAVVLFIAPEARHSLYGLALLAARQEWAQRWLDAGVPLPRLWMMPRSPLNVEQFAALARALADDDSARLEGGIDPRVVWALHERELHGERLLAYTDQDLTVVEAITLHDRNITPDDWASLLDAAIPDVGNHARFDDAVQFIAWARTSRASTHPSNFNTNARNDNGPTRQATMPEALKTILAWTTNTSAGPAWITPSARAACPLASTQADTKRARRQRCPQCGATPRAGHRHWFGNAVVGMRSTHGRRTIAEWVTITGSLAPYFLAAGIGLDEAEAILEQDRKIDEEALGLLAALGSGADKR